MLAVYCDYACQRYIYSPKKSTYIGDDDWFKCGCKNLAVKV